MLERAEQLWLVYEHLLPFDRRSTPDLVFESELALRRVRNYPADWLRLPDEALWALFAAR